MAEPNLNAIVDTTSAGYATVPSEAAYQQIQPENQFEDVLATTAGTTSALAELGSEPGAFMASQFPSFGGTVVSTGVSSLGSGGALGGSSFGGYGVGSYASGGSVGGSSFGGGSSNVPVFGNNVGGTSNFSSPGNLAVGPNGEVDPNGLQQTITDEGMRQVMVMLAVQRATRVIQLISNVITESHRANLNNVRNIRS